MAEIDYLTVSISQHKCKYYLTTYDVLCEFAQILPDLYKNTCQEAICSRGTTQRITQYGITVSKQYGTAKSMGWKFSVQLSGAYWHALDYKFNAVENILNNHTAYRISRLDLKKDVCVPLKQWRRYYSFAFKRKDFTLNGKEDARTVYLGSRQSQFFQRVYNKTADDPLNYPAPKNKVIIRAEIEIHRIKGDLVLDHAFDEEFTNRIFEQRLKVIASKDQSYFIYKYFEANTITPKIKTCKRKIGNIEKSVDYVFEAYKPYIIAGIKSEAFMNKYINSKDNDLSIKTKKIITVLNEREKGRKE